MARKKQPTAGEIITANIMYFKSTTGIEDEPLYLAARLGRTAWYDRLKHPEKFRIAELMGIARKLDVPLMCLIEPKEV